MWSDVQNYICDDVFTKIIDERRIFYICFFKFLQVILKINDDICLYDKFFKGHDN